MIMKKIMHFLLALVVMAGMFQFTSCDKDTKEKEVYLSAILDNSEYMYVELGEVLPLVDFSKIGTKTGLEITSSNADVVSIKDGAITAQKCGETVISISLDGEILGSYNVMVYDKNGNVFIIDNGVEVWPVDYCLDSWYQWYDYDEEIDDYMEVIEHGLTFCPNAYKSNGSGMIFPEETNEKGIVCHIDIKDKGMDYSPLTPGSGEIERAVFRRVNARPLGTLSYRTADFLINSFDVKLDGEVYEITCEGTYEIYESLRDYSGEDNEPKLIASGTAYLHYKGEMVVEESYYNNR